MPPAKLALANLRIETPCQMDWNEMTGDHLERYCAHCEKSVHDVSAMTLRDAEALLASGGKLCVRFYRDSTGSVMTAESPSRVLVERRTFAKAMAGAASALLPIFGQENTTPPVLTGTVRDEIGTVLPEVQTLVKRGDEVSTRVKTDSKGQFRIENLTPGTYQLVAQAAGFRTATKEIKVHENTQVNVDVELQVGQVGGAAVEVVPSRSILPNKLK